MQTDERPRGTQTHAAHNRDLPDCLPTVELPPPVEEECQFGGVVRRSTRDASALADEILRRYRLQRRKNSAPPAELEVNNSPPQCARIRGKLLVDWPRTPQEGSSWKSYTGGFCYILKDKHAGELRKRILTDMCVGQGVRRWDVKRSCTFSWPRKSSLDECVPVGPTRRKQCHWIKEVEMANPVDDLKT